MEINKRRSSLVESHLDKKVMQHYMQEIFSPGEVSAMVYSISHTVKGLSDHDHDKCGDEKCEENRHQIIDALMQVIAKMLGAAQPHFKDHLLEVIQAEGLNLQFQEVDENQLKETAAQILKNTMKGATH